MQASHTRESPKPLFLSFLQLIIPVSGLYRKTIIKQQKKPVPLSRLPFSPKKEKTSLSLSLSPLPISDATRRLRLCSILPTILSLSKPEPESEPEPEPLRSSPESLRLRAAVHLHIHLLLLLLRRLLRLSLHIPSLFSKSRSYPCPNSYSHSSFI